jgi:hypothetical protein
MEQDYNALVGAGPLVESLAAGVRQRDLLRGSDFAHMQQVDKQGAEGLEALLAGGT